MRCGCLNECEHDVEGAGACVHVQRRIGCQRYGKTLISIAFALYPEKKGHLQEVVEDVRRAIEPLILPDAAKVLAAMATDIMTCVQRRNDRADINDACAALRTAIALLEAVHPDLDG
jgi:hypothetical protein